jgi:hypothetical protein
MNRYRLDELKRQSTNLTANPPAAPTPSFRSAAARGASTARRQVATALAPHPSLIDCWPAIADFLDWIASQTEDDADRDKILLVKIFGARAAAGLTY